MTKKYPPATPFLEILIIFQLVHFIHNYAQKNILLFLYVCEQQFRLSKMRIAQKVKFILM